MKCKNCGAEIIDKSNFCEFCGSQISADMKKEQEYLNKKVCPNCSSSNVNYTRENQGELNGKKSKRILYRTVGVCNDCGFTWYADVNSKKSNNSDKKLGFGFWAGFLFSPCLLQLFYFVKKI